jgi:crotonobetainyl-CoA:carnitine CoA-transferase CaiB-like acyl-CoA transferase
MRYVRPGQMDERGIGYRQLRKIKLNLIISVALHYRHITGKGQMTDVSPAEALGRMINYNWWVRGIFEKISDTVDGDLVVANLSWKMSGSPWRVKWICRPVGADNEFIFNTLLGMGKGKVQELRENGAV